MEKVDFDTWIQGTEYRTRMSVDLFDDNEVWVNITHQSGSAHLTINKEGAKDLIAALIRIVNEMDKE